MLYSKSEISDLAELYHSVFFFFDAKDLSSSKQSGYAGAPSLAKLYINYILYS